MDIRGLLLMGFFGWAITSIAEPFVEVAATPLSSRLIQDLLFEEVSHGGGLNACGCHFNRKNRRLPLPPEPPMWMPVPTACMKFKQVNEAADFYDVAMNKISAINHLTVK